ncbi:hypothetical protein Sm713_76020 [Streptomyces sp. TS71-3]|nr:hypothetical protein Sm713_76020 [Streptomyces sp. TS71-3]
MEAFLATYGARRPAGRPLSLGSVKSNIGHTQAAAGMASVIKTVQAMAHGVLPRTLHAEQPTPRVDWSAGTVSLLTRAMPWPVTGQPRRTGISSFGISGTNAHLILEEAPGVPVQDTAVMDTPAAPEAERPGSVALRGSVSGIRTGGAPSRSPEDAAVPAGAAAGVQEGAPGPAVAFPLSARSEAALRAQARRIADRVAGDPGCRPLDVGFSLATTRAAFPHRAVALARDRAELLDALDAVAHGRSRPEVSAGHPRPAGAVAFLFTGQGSQRAGMGRDLYRSHPAFARAFDAVCAHLEPLLPRPLPDVVFAPEGSAVAGLLHTTEFAQPALFALEVALFRLWEAWGVRPDLVAGHSVGEVAAGHVAGALPLPDACRLVAARGRLMQALPAGGAMAAVRAAEDEVRASLAGREPEVDIAAVNGPLSVVVSGDEAAVQDVADLWSGRGRQVTRLRVSQAFHSPRMDPALAGLTELAAGLAFAPPTIPLVTGVTGRPAGFDELRAPDHWARQARRPVRFADTLRYLWDQGVTHVLELGPDAQLTALARDCLADAPQEVSGAGGAAGGGGVAGGGGGGLAGGGAAGGAPHAVPPVLVPALRRDRAEDEALLAAAAGLHAQRVDVDWGAVF